MKRTDIQKAIIPRNWLFGRLISINNSLRGIVKNSKHNLTQEEWSKIESCYLTIKNIIKDKEKSSATIKKRINESK